MILAMLIITVGPPALLAQDADQTTFGTWDAVKAIQPGQKLALKLKNGRDVKGTLNNATDSGITLGRGSKAVTIGRDEVQRIFLETKMSSGRPALLGALIGAGIGAGGIAIAAAADDTGGTDGELTGVVIGVALAGAGVGALIGSIFRNKKKLTLIYEAR